MTTPLFTILQSRPGGARRGRITTPHGTVDTPAFLPVGTQATVKSLTQRELADMGAQMILGNTYHLYLRPGADVVAAGGGLAAFQAWSGPTFTDSGGFQVFSLGLGRAAKAARADPAPNAAPEGLDATQPRLFAQIDEEGVTFRSHLDGSRHRFTPESAIATQHQLGADIIVSFDECAPHPATHAYTRAAMDRTHRWAARGLVTHAGHGQQALYGVVQGGAYQDLRVESAKAIDAMAFPGLCIGGVSVGEGKEQMRACVDWVMPHLDPARPRHLLGVGDIDDLFMGVRRGIDTFDCVMPTRIARTGTLLVHPDTAREAGSRHPYRLIARNQRFATDFTPPDPRCACGVCATYTRAYLHHLFRADELLGVRLASYHNVWTLLELMRRMRTALEDDTLEVLEREYHLA